MGKAASAAQQIYNVILIAMALAVGFVVAEVIFKAMRPFLIRFIAKLPKVQTKSRRGKSA